MSFFEELKRRNVVRVGAAYGIAAWVILQVADLVLENIDAPPWVIQAMMLVVGLGFIAAIVIAWAYEMTPEGIKREADVDRSQSVVAETGRKLDRIVIGFMALALAWFVYDKQTTPPLVEPVPLLVTEADTEAETESEPSIAVLPFADMSPEKDQEYFSDGISEELLNLLARVDGLKVASRTSSFAFKGSQQSLAAIADALKVDHVLEGSIRKADNRIRITAQLIDAATDRHLWSETYDRELVDIFAIQDEIANAIVEALRAELGMLQDTPVITVTAVTKNLDAYELYLKARTLFIERNQLDESIRLFEQAVALDPDFARAWEGLGAVYSVAPSWGITDRDYQLLSVEVSNKALELNPDLSMALAVLGFQFGISYESSMNYMERALQNDRKNATAYLWRSINWATLGFFKKALDDANSCLDVDPFYENCRRHVAMFQLLQGDTELAIETFQISAERGFFGAEFFFSSALIKQDKRLAAALGLWRWFTEDRSFPVEAILDAVEFPDQDHTKGLAKLLSWIERNGETPEENFTALAFFREYQYVNAEFYDEPMMWMERFSGFRQSPHFKRLLNELGVPVYWREHGFPPQCRPQGEEDFECD